jgi:hypothetical protein
VEDYALCPSRFFFISLCLFFFVIMALISLAIVVGVLIILTLWKRVTRKSQVPLGLKKLPGPKGMLAFRQKRMGRLSY